MQQAAFANQMNLPAPLANAIANQMSVRAPLAYASHQRGGCECPPGYSTTGTRYKIAPDFPMNQVAGCPSPLGGIGEARAQVGYTSTAGQVAGGVDQRFTKEVEIVAASPSVSFDTGIIVLPDTDGIISEVMDLRIRKLSIDVLPSGSAAALEAFNRTSLFNNTIVEITQGGRTLYRNSLFKYQVTDFGRLGFDLEINPVTSDFNGVKFRLTGVTATNSADDYDLLFTLIAQWA